MTSPEDLVKAIEDLEREMISDEDVKKAFESMDGALKKALSIMRDHVAEIELIDAWIEFTKMFQGLTGQLLKGNKIASDFADEAMWLVRRLSDEEDDA